MLQRVDISAASFAADIGTVLSQPDWRRHVGWPVGLSETNTICVRQVRDALAFTRGLGDPSMRDAATLALPVVLAYGRAIVLASLAVNRAGPTKRSAANDIKSAAACAKIAGQREPDIATMIEYETDVPR